MRSHNSLLKALKGTFFLLLLLSLIIGVPLGLVFFVGWPLPTSLPSWAEVKTHFTDSTKPISDTTLVKALACLLWVLWTQLSAAFFLALIDKIRGRSFTRRVFLIGGVQRLISALVSGVAFIVPMMRPAIAGAEPVPLERMLDMHSGGNPLSFGFTGNADRGTTAHEPAWAGPLGHTAFATDPSLDPFASVSDAESVIAAGVERRGSATTQERRWAVERGDSFWGIAESVYGDGTRWTEIRARNLDRIMPDGTRITGAVERVRPGWVLFLPSAEQIAREDRRKHNPAFGTARDAGSLLSDSPGPRTRHPGHSGHSGHLGHCSLQQPLEQSRGARPAFF